MQEDITQNNQNDLPTIREVEALFEGEEEKFKEVTSEDSAKNGETVNFLRSLDLSKSEDFSTFLEVVSWMRKGNYLDKEGRVIIPFNFFCSLHDIIIFFYSEKLYDHNNKKNLLLAPSVFGQTFNDIRIRGDLFGEKDLFLENMGKIVKFVSSSFFGGLPGGLVSTWSFALNSGKISEDFIKKHPNYLKLEELKTQSYDLFFVIREVFTKYISLVISGQNYLSTVKDLSLIIARVEEDEKALSVIVEKESSYSKNKEQKYRDYKERADELFFDEELDSEVSMFLSAITEYRKIFDWYNEHLAYPNPKG